MEKENKNITRLFQILENPELYTDREINDIINADDECRGMYELMADVKRSYNKQEADKADIDTDAEWNRFKAENIAKKPVYRAALLHRSRRIAIAASVAVVLALGGIAYAAIQHYGRTRNETRVETKAEEKKTQERTATIAAETPQSTLETEKEERTAAETKTFDNIELSEILSEIAAFYGIETVTFNSEETRHLRFYLTWNPQESVESIVSILNHYEKVNIRIVDNKMIVE